MFCPDELPQVGIGDLSRNPRRVLERVLCGERLIICRHGHPVATLQPLKGSVTQPFERAGTAASYDVGGRRLGEIDREIARLAPAEKELLMDAVRQDRIQPIRVKDFGLALKTLRAWEMTGMARKTPRGWVLTGRSMLLREALLERAGLRQRLFG